MLPVPPDLVGVVVPGEGQQRLGAAPHPTLEAPPPGRGDGYQLHQLHSATPVPVHLHPNTPPRGFDDGPMAATLAQEVFENPFQLL